MPTVVTLDVFAGLPNPSWTLSDEETVSLTDRIHAIQEPTPQKSSGVSGKLGYRGFIVSYVGSGPSHPSFHVHEGIVDKGMQQTNVISRERELESFLFSTMRGEVSDAVRSYVDKEIKSPISTEISGLFRLPIPGKCPVCKAHDAPVYNPGKWNIPSVQPHNNCYNYANDHITNTFAQPGRAHGKPITALSCPGVEPSAHADGLANTPNFGHTLPPGHGWFVALVIWPGVDYHWYRQDTVGCWSHKPGGTPARNTDDSGHHITDPKTCNRGPYTVFCNYMITTRAVVIK